MPTTIKNTEKINYKEFVNTSNKVKSYAEEPFFMKKAEEAKETLNKVGLPKRKKNK